MEEIAFLAEVEMVETVGIASLEEGVTVVMEVIVNKVPVVMVEMEAMVLEEEDEEVLAGLDPKEPERMETMETQDNRD